MHRHMHEKKHFKGPWNIFFHWLVITKKPLLRHNQTFFTLTFWSQSETFIRRSLFSSSGSCHDRDVTWQEIGHSSVCTVAALVSVQGSSSLFPNMCCFFNPSSTFVRFPVHAEPYVRPISCHITFLSWQEPEEELNKLSSDGLWQWPKCQLGKKNCLVVLK